MWRSLKYAVQCLALTGIAAWFFLWPGSVVVRAIFDANLYRDTPAAHSWTMHRALSGKFAAWAQTRVQNRAAAQLSLADIAGTEWPAYSAVFYLRATANLEQAWQTSLAKATRRTSAAELSGQQAPSVYARRAIDAAAEIIVDPNNADWVKRYWRDPADPEAYLKRENVFYRMLLIDGLASYVTLIGRQQTPSHYLELLATQTDTLSAELDASAYGLLDDYPRQCYPTDIAAAWGAIARSDQVMGTDHSARIARGVRGFIGAAADPILRLPPFTIDKNMPTSAAARGLVRGSYTSAMLFQSAEIWPEQSARWYARYEKLFFRRGWLLTGFRELPELTGPENFMDVDAGPVFAGLGTAASAFGVAAARAHGRFDHARPLQLEMLAVSWPLPNGSLMLARGVSDLSDAPFMGEAAILFNLTQATAPAFRAARTQTGADGHIPGLVWLMLCGYFGVAILLLRIAWRAARCGMSQN